MWFWWLMLCCDILIPVIMIVAGWMMWKHPPKEVNGLIGYRTARSMQNMETWRFAHDYSGRLWWKIGWIMLLPSILAHVPVYRETVNVIGAFGLILMTVQTIVLIASVFPTERALRRTFTDTGIRR